MDRDGIALADHSIHAGPFARNIHLVSISVVPDQPVRGKWFGDNLAAAQAWAMAENADQRGVYWSANTGAPKDGKYSKADLAAGCHRAFVDIDPPKDGSAWDKGAALADLIARGNPSFVIDSGGGWQGVWDLTAPLSVPELEELNKGIAQAFNADDCWNADRVLRWPDTINWPTERKVARGRVPVPTAMATVTGYRFDPAALRQSFPYVPQAAAPATGGEHGEIPDTPYTLQDLPERASAALRALVDTPESQQGDRSVHVSHVVAQMGREGFTDAEILGVILNPDLPVSAHCLDQKAPERAARRKAFLAGAWRLDVATILATPPTPPPAALSEPPVVTATRDAGMTARGGGTNGFMFIDQQARHFKGCVYVTSLDRVLLPNGALLNQSRFDARMGGYQFALDADNKDTTDSAWTAFLKNRAYSPPTADERCFRPALPTRALIHEGSRVLVNTYVPINTPRHAGDPSKFLDWLARCFPIERDRDILLHYMASMVQNVGRKFFWWPVIQSTEGTGKGLIMDLMRHCIGPQYTHLPNTSKMTRQGMNFNGWIEGKLFLGLNEIYSANRRDFLEELKTTVTDTVLPIEGKGIEEATLDNYANGIMFTNHQDGVPVTVDTRRYCVLYMALQSERDITRAGMDGRYFADLFDWAYGRNAYAGHGPNHGLAIVHEYLATYPLTAALDPAQLATRAPQSSSSTEAVRASLGRVEQEVLEAIEQGQPGFCGGWVSSIMLDRLLDAKRMSVPRNKRRDMMRVLGYDWHPALADGRVNEQVTPDIGKPKLFIRDGHLALNFTSPAEVARAYSKAQTEAAAGAAAATLSAR